MKPTQGETKHCHGNGTVKTYIFNIFEKICKSELLKTFIDYLYIVLKLILNNYISSRNRPDSLISEIMGIMIFIIIDKVLNLYNKQASVGSFVVDHLLLRDFGHHEIILMNVCV
jgi:hypothetical protein